MKIVNGKYGGRRGKEEDVLAQLTEQEQRILELIAQGQTNREIAA